MQEILEFINSGEYRIEADWISKNTFAHIVPLENLIVLNITLLVAEAFVHEYMHDKYPYLSEKAIIKKTTRMMNRMTVPQIHTVAQKVMDQIELNMKTMLTIKINGRQNHGQLSCKNV
jgi:hypothetical protein|tara:strand:+ start:282 stop:635 length:354 start_codon:yes stop_codon:yes gene_type:complete